MAASVAGLKKNCGAAADEISKRRRFQMTAFDPVVLRLSAVGLSLVALCAGLDPCAPGITSGSDEGVENRITKPRRLGSVQ